MNLGQQLSSQFTRDEYYDLESNFGLLGIPSGGFSVSLWADILSHIICFLNMHKKRKSPLEVAFRLRAEFHPKVVGNGFRVRLYKPRNSLTEQKRQNEINQRFNMHRQRMHRFLDFKESFLDSKKSFLERFFEREKEKGPQMELKKISQCEWDREMKLKDQFTKERIRYARSIGHGKEADQLEKERKGFNAWYAQSGLPEVFAGQEEPHDDLEFRMLTSTLLREFRTRPTGPSFDTDMNLQNIVHSLSVLGMAPTYGHFEPEPL